MKMLNDAERLDAVQATRLMDTPATSAFDRLTQLASKLLDSPGAMVSLLDHRRQFFKSAVGLPPAWEQRREIPLTHSFCRHLVETGSTLIVPDARHDAEFQNNPAIHELKIVAYLGVPLRTLEGHTLGTFCVFDHRPRHWAPGEVGLISALAQSVLSEIDLHIKIAEQREDQAHHQSRFEQLPLAAMACGADGRITRWNPAAARLFGFTAAQAVGTLPHELLYATEQQATVKEYLQQLLLMRGERGNHCQHAASTADGSEVICEWWLTPQRAPDGKMEGFIAMAGDITLQIHAQARQAKLESELRHARKLAAIGQLTSGVAHDFNNLIAVIMGHAEILRTADPLPGGLGESIAEIAEAAQRGANLTRELLRFSRKQPVHFSRLNLSPTVANIIKLLRRLLGKDIQLNLCLASGPLEIYADANQLDQVVMNLVVNARDAMSTGGQLTIETSMVEFAGPGREPRRTGRFACLAVGDTGCGIAPEILPQVFDPFFTTKIEGQGTGIGLATVRDIVEQHQGWIEIDSTVKQGTKVRVYLPQTDRGRVSAPEIGPLSATDAAKTKVLEEAKLLRAMADR